MKPLRLGVIGLSPGNGHPYSWSAVFNGYHLPAMEECGFPVIPRYLEQQKFPEDAIAEAKVTHVWAQDKTIAAHIAKASLIENVVGNFTDLIGQVDGVLLARDDAEKHCQFAMPFLDAGIPIYVDKPLALSVEEARQMIDRQQYPGQLFSCSALKYASELQLSESDVVRIGRIRHIHATVPKDWEKYAIHVIEPLLLLIKDRGSISRIQSWREGDVATVAVSYSGGIQVLISSLGAAHAPIAMRVFGDTGWSDLIFKNTFRAFKASLHDFVQGILHRDVRTPAEFILEAIYLVESGRNH